MKKYQFPPIYISGEISVNEELIEEAEKLENSIPLMLTLIDILGIGRESSIPS